MPHRRRRTDPDTRGAAALASLREKAEAGPLVLYCHHGVRSLQAVAWLRSQGFLTCRSLQGGIDRWSVVTDPSVPRY